MFFSSHSLRDPVKHDCQYHDGNPPSNPRPIFIWMILFKTTSPRSPAEIMAATTTFFGTCRMLNAVSLATGGRAKMIVAKASGTVPIL